MHHWASRLLSTARSSTDVYSASHPSTQPPRPRKLSRWGERVVVVLIGIQSVIDGVYPIYHETIKVCDSLRLFHMCLIDVNTMNEGAIFDPTISLLGRRSSFVSYHLVGSQADNLFYLNPHRTRATVSLRLPTQTQTTEREIPIRHAMPEKGSVFPPHPGHHR